MSQIKIITTLILMFSILVSCSSDNEVNIENQLTINVDGIDYESINEKIYGNENCDVLFLTASYDDKEIDFTIEFEISKEGQIRSFSYREFNPEQSSSFFQMYLLPNFNPTSAFNISDFYYNEVEGQVKFNFNGTVYYEHDNSIERDLSGEISINSLKSVECSVAKTGLYYNSEEISLYSYYNNLIEDSNGNQTHRFFSNNGFAVYLYASSNLWDYPLGEIVFNENDVTDKVEFKQFIEPIKADQTQNFDLQQWKNFDTSGEIIIEDKYTENDQQVIKGKLNLLIKDNGNEVYILNNIEFITFNLI